MSAARRRQVPAPQTRSTDDALRLRAHSAIAKIITFEPKLEDMTGPELLFTVSALEWFAGMPTPGEGQ